MNSSTATRDAARPGSGGQAASGVRAERLSVGVPGLDEVLLGGLLPGQTYVVIGSPGAGKTTLAMHFAQAGVRAGERVLYITLKESERELWRGAASLGLDLTGVNLLDLSPAPERFAQEQPYDVFATPDVERAPLAKRISETLGSLRPQRVVIDPINTFRYLSPETYQFRQLVLSLMHLATADGATLLAPVETSALEPESDLQFMADSIIEMLKTRTGRKVRVTKFGGSGSLPGEHTMSLDDRGMHVFPRLVPSAHRRAFEYAPVPSGLRELDEMLHGGPSSGTLTLVSGPTGVGKTTLGLQFMKEAASRGERSVVYTFDEDPAAIRARSEGIGIPIGDMLERGTLSLVKVESLQYSPDEFAHEVRQEVEQRGARVIMIDGLDGYNLSIRMRGEDLASHLHAMAEYLDNMGVMSILTADVAPIAGAPFQITDQRISYLADNAIFMRWLEMGSALHRVIGVLKMRLTGHEKTLREFDITPEGLKLGRPLLNARGILTGVPELDGGDGRRQTPVEAGR